jgi:hypothetical protein
MNENFQFAEFPEYQSFSYDWMPVYQPPLEPLNTDVIIPGPSEPSTGDRVPKLAISRIAPPLNSTSSGRVSRACESCREQKAKCSGHRPTCHRCRDSGAQCSYGDRKKERILKWVTFSFSTLL